MSFLNEKLDYTKEENQTKVLKEFRRILQDILEPAHDDTFLLRWLKARDFDITKSEKMIRESFKFRKKIGADFVLTAAYQVPEVYNVNPVTAFLGWDNEHSTVRLLMPGICDFKGYVYSLPVWEILKLVMHYFEGDLKKLEDKKKTLGKPDLRMTLVFDFKGFTLKKFYDKTVINVGIKLIQMYQDNYPETLKTAYFVNVPASFMWCFTFLKPFINSVTLSKIKFFNSSDDWQGELRKVMDPKIIPGFLGGDRTDPNGNPKCTDLIPWRTKIDRSYYMDQNEEKQDTDLNQTTIQQRGVFQFPVDVTAIGCALKYTFWTKDYNIRFGLFFKPENSKKVVDIIPVENVDCHVVPEQNDFVCEKKGTYILHFDNSYSWWHAKQLHYKVQVEPKTV